VLQCIAMCQQLWQFLLVPWFDRAGRSLHTKGPLATHFNHHNAPHCNTRLHNLYCNTLQHTTSPKSKSHVACKLMPPLLSKVNLNILLIDTTWYLKSIVNPGRLLITTQYPKSIFNLNNLPIDGTPYLKSIVNLARRLPNRNPLSKVDFLDRDILFCRISSLL